MSWPSPRHDASWRDARNRHGTTNALLVRTVESFAEPDFSRLQRLVFADLQQPSPELASVEAAESEVRSKRSTTHPPIYRLGAFDGENLVGWSYGRHERGNVFYMANSGVVPPHRRRGVFSSLLNAIREHALSAGAIAVRSQHSVLDPAVIIAKLRTGFLISGLNQSAHM